jgi:hypothetical protein
MSIGRTSRAASVAFSLALALSCAACTSEPSKNLFGDAPDEGSGATNGSGSKNGSGGSVSLGGGAASGGAQTDNGGTTSDTGGGASSGATTNGGATSIGGTNGAGGVSSGGVSNAAGGAGSGGKNGGTGGRTGDGGSTASGGTDADSGSGAGGDQDSGSSTGGAPPVERRVRCGDTATCDLSAGEACCVRDVSTGMGPGGGITHQVATCVKDTMNCDRVFRCDNDADCAHGEHCCLDFSSSQTMPSATCSAKACDSPLACSVPADCPSGKTCCGAIGTVPMAGVKYTSVTCADSCKTSTLAAVFCVDDSVCGSNTSCLQSATLPPGYLVCRLSAGP